MVSDNQPRKDHNKGSSKIPCHVSKWNHGVSKQASISGLKYVINTLRMNCHDSLLMESFIRGVVRDVVETKLQERGLLSRENVNKASKSGSRQLELCFINNDKLPNTTFTKTNIIPKDEQLQVAIIDVGSKSIVNDGPFSSIKIQICPIKSKFECCDDEDWTEAEFNDNILHERQNKEPLLVGDQFLTLKNGVASISEIMLTDNSGWVRNKKFSLGAKALKNGENIKEGRSKAFRVKDIRGESYKKHYPPFLNDDVWRLEKIAENGPFHDRLRGNGIHTVKDLLRLLIINESSLREKFGKIQKKCWSNIIEHARLCVVDDNMLYTYAMIGQPILLIFNVIYELVGVTFDAQKFYLPDNLTLTPYQKNLVEIVKQDAYKNIEYLKEIDEALLNSTRLEECIKLTQDLQQNDISEVQGYAEPLTSTLNVNDGMQNVQINVDSTENLPNVSPLNTTLEPKYDVIFRSFVDLLNCDIDISNSEKPKAVWCKIRAVVKWGITVRRVVAAKRNEDLFYFNYDSVF